MSVSWFTTPYQSQLKDIIKKREELVETEKHLIACYTTVTKTSIVFGEWLSSFFLFTFYLQIFNFSILVDRENFAVRQTHVDNLWRMVAYCENKTDCCRRGLQLSYFGEPFNRQTCKSTQELYVTIVTVRYLYDHMYISLFYGYASLFRWRTLYQQRWGCCCLPSHRSLIPRTVFWKRSWTGKFPFVTAFTSTTLFDLIVLSLV